MVVIWILTLRDKKHFQFYALSLNDYFTPPHSLKSHTYTLMLLKSDVHIWWQNLKICIKRALTQMALVIEEKHYLLSYPLWLCRNKHFIVAQLLNCVRFFATPWTAKYQSPLSFTVSQSLLRFMFIEYVIDPLLVFSNTFNFYLTCMTQHVGYVFGTKLECWDTNMGKSKTCVILLLKACNCKAYRKQGQFKCELSHYWAIRGMTDAHRNHLTFTCGMKHSFS